MDEHRTPAPEGAPPPRALETQLLLFADADPLAPDAMRALLERRLGAPVRLALTRNRTSVLTFQKRPGGGFDLRMQRVFLEAPDDVVDAIVSFVLRPSRAAREKVAAFFHARPAAERRPARPHALPPTPRTRGVALDLAEVLAALNARYFGGRLATRITWGSGRAGGSAAERAGVLGFEAEEGEEAGEGPSGLAARRGGRGRTIRFGSYIAEHDLIRIHPALDAPWVPRFFVESIVYHEMMHAVIPIAKDASGRRCIHSSEFRRREREFHAHGEALAWERENLPRLLEARG
jgi:hypothetical protein